MNINKLSIVCGLFGVWFAFMGDSPDVFISASLILIALADINDTLKDKE